MSRTISVDRTNISIHSLRMEGDIITQIVINTNIYFNPLPPHGGRRCADTDPAEYLHFNPLPPHGGRLDNLDRRIRANVISIHSLRMEGDQTNQGYGKEAECNFNPLPPHGGRQRTPERCTFRRNHFNPLPPHGGRLLVSYLKEQILLFQSTPSAWRETNFGNC